MSTPDLVTRAVERSRLRDAIVSCTACPLHAGCRGPVPFSGSVDARVMLIGEAPGTEEDRAGRPFVGPSGKVLAMAMRDVGLYPERMFVTNTVKCKPPGFPPTPNQQAVDVCTREHLRAEIAMVDPDWIVAVGAVATRFFWRIAIGKVHGRPFQGLAGPGIGRWVMPTYHPAAGLRDEKRMANLRDDLATFARVVDDEGARDMMAVRHGAKL